jgi:hypothetical protein
MNVRFQLMLPEPQRLGLTQLAEKTGSSTVSLIRLAIQQMLERREVHLSSPNPVPDRP